MFEINYLKTPDEEIVCSVNCKHKEDCANHVSAADMRTEVGQRPRLTLKDDKIFCSSYDHELLKATMGAVTLEQLQNKAKLKKICPKAKEGTCPLYMDPTVCFHGKRHKEISNCKSRIYPCPKCIETSK